MPFFTHRSQQFALCTKSPMASLAAVDANPLIRQGPRGVFHNTSENNSSYFCFYTIPGPLRYSMSVQTFAPAGDGGTQFGRLVQYVSRP
jgi:hypothetical protein